MATLLTSNTYGANSGNTTMFRAYGTAISNAFANAGWIQVDTNSAINWTTVVANGSAGVYSGSEVWRMNDALQNTAPIYVCVNYGTGSGGNRPALAITVGHSSNGSGGLCGALSSNVVMQTGVVISSTYPCYFTGSNNYIIFCMWLTSAYALVFSIERTHDSNGDDTAEGALITWIMNGSYAQQFWNITTGGAPAETSVGAFIQGIAQTGVPPKFNWYPVWFSKGTFLNPSKNIIYGSINHFTSGAISTVTHYGAAHNYVALPVWGSSPANRAAATASNFRVSVLWE